MNEMSTITQTNVVSKEDQLFINKSDRIFGGAGSNCISAQGSSKTDVNTLLSS